MSGGEITEDQQPLLDYLSAPGVLGDTPAKVIDTACAHVLLSGDVAFKLKRAIRYDYLDFGARDKRNAAAAAEITLNRRTAPDIYRGLVPVYREGAGFRLGPLATAPKLDPDAAEHLIAMRRFDETATLDCLAADGRLLARHIDQLADAIARFHDAAAPEPMSAAGDRLKRVSARTMAEITGQPDVIGPAADRLDRVMRAALDAAAPLVDARGEAGCIRRLHGDLHLANVALIDGAPVVFDALEFDDAVATVDMLHDLAFLVMDLWVRERGDLAARAWSRYLAMRDDYSGLSLAPLFIAMRAAVRAKVALNVGLLLEGDARRAKQDEARMYARAAEAALTPQRPRLIAIGGLSGTGKTTLARDLAPALAAAVGAVHLRSDVLRKRMANVPFEAPLPSTAYGKETSRAVYAGLAERAAAALAAGAPVIVDAVAADPAERAALEDVARRAGAPFSGLWLDLPLADRQARIEGRSGDASDATAAVAAKQADYDLGHIAWARIDAGAGALEAARAALGLENAPSLPHAQE